MTSCRLCGYDISLDSAEKQKPCPICGESSLVSLKDDIKGMTVGIDAPLAWNKAETQQHSSWREKSQFHQGDSTKAPPSSFINPELLSLLQLVPKPQQRKAKAKREVQAAGALTPRPLVNTPPTGLNAVYIRPHADPLRHLKGRYNTQPRIARAVSMSALYRLADPLTGHDSMEALAPQARRRREESIKRLMGSRHGRNKAYGKAGHVHKETRASVDLQRKVVPSRRSLSGGNSGIKLARHRRQNSADSTGFGVGREHYQRRRLKTPFKLTKREKVERRPLYSSRPRKNAEQRTTPSLYRKRVATMRNVDGWVREVDPSSARRGGHTVDKNSRSDGTPAECPEAKRDSIGGCGIFLTEIGSNNGCSRGLVDAATRNREKIRARVEGCRADRFGSETDRGVKLAPSAIKPVKNVSREFLKRAKKISYDFRAGDGKRRGHTVKRVVNSIHRTHQQKIPPSTKALFPSRGMNTAIGSLEKRLNWEGASERAFQTTTISDCDWCVGEQPTTLATNDKQSELSSSQGPHAVFSSPEEEEVIQNKANALETARQGLPQRGIAPVTSQHPANIINLIPLQVENSLTSGRPCNVWQCLGDTSNDPGVGSLMRLVDDSGGDGGCEKGNLRAASGATIARLETIPRRNGRDRQRQTQFDLAAEAHERPEPMLYERQPRSILPTFLVYQSEASDSATLMSTSPQRLARSRDAARCRVKRQSRINEPAGLMQRLDRNPVKVGDVIVEGHGGNCPGRDGVSSQHLRRFGLGSCGTGSYRGKLLVSAAPVPLLHVGGGYGFKLRR